MSSGGSRSTTVGYWYRLLYHFGICKGPVDAFLEFRGGDRVAWSGAETENTRISVSKPNLWGGKESEGGLDGDLDILFGDGNQQANDYLVAQLGADQPTYRGKLSVVWRGGRWGAMNPYPKPPAFKVRRILKGWDNDAPWYPATAVIGPGIESVQPQTMQLRYSINVPSSFPAVHANAVAYGANEFIAGFGFGYVATSQDGLNWSASIEFGTGVAIYAVAYGLGQWIIAGSAGGLWRRSGASWEARAAGFDNSRINGLAQGDGRWVAVGGEGKIAVSLNGGADWVQKLNPFTSHINAVAFGGGVWIAVGDSGEVGRSTDGGETWALVEAPIGSESGLYTVAYGSGRWVIGGGSILVSAPRLATSADGGVTWAVGVTSGQAISVVRSVCFTEGLWIAVGYVYSIGYPTFRLLASTDTLSWVAWPQSLGQGTTGTGIASGNGRMVTTVAEGLSSDPNGTFGKILAASAPEAPLLTMNPAHILYDSIAAEDMQGEPAGMINDTSFRAAADKLYSEGFGLCIVYDGGSIEEFQQRVCDIIGGSLTQSRVDGQYYLDLIRGDYVLEELPVVTADDIVEFSQEPSILTEQPNQVGVEWFDPQEKLDRTTAPLQALGAIQAAGGVIPETRTYREIPTEALALRVGARDLQALATPTSRFRLTLNRRIFDLRPGRPFRLQYPAEGLGDMVCVLGDIDTGTLTDGRIRIVAVQDVYGFPATVYVGGESGLAQPPATTPEPSPHQLLLEAPFVELIGNLSRADLAVLPSDIGMVMTAATRSTTGLNYAVHTAADGEDYAAGGNSEWCPTALINEVAGYLDTAFTLTAGSDLDDVQVGTWAQWDSEIVRVDALDTVAGTITLGRGCADTVPVQHLDGSRIFFCGDWAGTDDREYVEGDTVRAKLLTRTSTEELLLENAQELSTTIVGRQFRPYPPGQVKINGEDYPDLIEGPLTASWAHRDRLLQDDKLIDTGMGAIGPEPGTTYIARLLRAADEALLAETEVDGSTAELSTTGEDNVILELLAVRGGVESWQRHRHPFLYTSVAPLYPDLVSATPVNFNTAASSHDIPLGTYVAGDLLVIPFSTRSDNTTSPSAPTGWRGATNVANTTAAPDGRRGYLYRIMDGTEGSTVTLTLPDSRIMTGVVLRFAAGTFEDDYRSLFHASITIGSGSTVSPTASSMGMYFGASTVIRTLGLFGLEDVSSYPFPSGTQATASGTGTASTSAKTVVNVSEDTGTIGGSYAWGSWGLSAGADYMDISLILRGKKPLGHIDPRLLLAFAFTSETNSVTTSFPDLTVGDMIIALSQAESGTTTGVSLSGGFTQFYVNGSFSGHYRVITSADLSANLTVTWSAFGNHCFHVIRVRAGTFNAAAAPEVHATNTGTSAAPVVVGATAAPGYAGRRNLAIFFESQVYTSTQAVVTDFGSYPIGRITSNSGATNAVSVGTAYQTFDGQSVPTESATLSASAAWRASLITLQGLPIP